MIFFRIIIKSEKYGKTPSAGEVQFSYAWVTETKTIAQEVTSWIKRNFMLTESELI